MNPDTVTISEDGSHLAVDWPDGTRSRIPAATLRGAARDARSVRERIEHGAVRVPPGVRLVGRAPVGSYAVNLHFDDGHDRGIFPWPMLRDLAAAAGPGSAGN